MRPLDTTVSIVVRWSVIFLLSCPYAFFLIGEFLAGGIVIYEILDGLWKMRWKNAALMSRKHWSKSTQTLWTGKKCLYLTLAGSFPSLPSMATKPSAFISHSSSKCHSPWFEMKTSGSSECLVPLYILFSRQQASVLNESVEVVCAASAILATTLNLLMYYIFLVS